jgi:hypothetical protein
MNINSAVIDIRLPAETTATEHRTNVIAAIRWLVGHPRPLQERPYLNVGDSYRISNGHRRHEHASSWIHTHH